MAKYATIDKDDSNKVVNLIEWDGVSTYTISANLDLILVADGVKVDFDYTYDYQTQTFSPPV